jgi:hypothetical protein
MMSCNSTRAIYLSLFSLCSLWLSGPISAASLNPEELLEDLNGYPHARQVSYSKMEVIDHEIGLGAMQKVRGEWRFKKSERLSGTLVSYTWQIIDGYTSAQAMKELLGSVAEKDNASLLFTCKGRACGSGAQWANRVFRERVLYGREDLQRYGVYAVQDVASYRLVAYSAARSEDRQYLRVDLLLITQ